VNVLDGFQSRMMLETARRRAMQRTLAEVNDRVRQDHMWLYDVMRLTEQTLAFGMRIQLRPQAQK